MRTALALPSVFLMSRWIEAGLRDKKSNNVFEKGSHIVEDCEGENSSKVLKISSVTTLLSPIACKKKGS